MNSIQSTVHCSIVWFYGNGTKSKSQKNVEQFSLKIAQYTTPLYCIINWTELHSAQGWCGGVWWDDITEEGC